MAQVIEPSETAAVFSGVCNEYSGKLIALPDKPEETVEATVRALWLKATGVAISAEKALTYPLPSLTAAHRAELDRLLQQRLAGIPLGHLTGRQSFMGLEFTCSKDALIPRKETEILATASRDLLKTSVLPISPQPRVLDLCCGSGNVACALACHVPSATVIATDLSAEAVELARQNARALGCAERMEFYSGDLFAPVDSAAYLQSFDLITCNPPYISTGKLTSMPSEIIGHEPKLAFDGGPLGIGVLWRFLQDAPRFLKEHGWLAFEVGLGQGVGMLQRLNKMPKYANVRGFSDQAGNPRALIAQLASKAG